MVMSWIYAGIVLLSTLCALFLHQGPQLSAAIMQGAESGLHLAVSIGGSVILWSGVGQLMDHIGLTGKLSSVLRPFLNLIFPSSKKDAILQAQLSANIGANILGLGNAATPMGIQAAKRMRSLTSPTYATGELCRLIVLNTASIQLIPSTVAALRSSLGAETPFDILPAVWLTSFCSAGMGLLFAWLFERISPHD